MEISRYLAMTAAEMAAFSLPEGFRHSYMACHFSCGSTGLSNLPDTLPRGSMLILNDSLPFSGHDPNRIAEELVAASGKLGFEAVLLDFERQQVDAYQRLCDMLIRQLPCPVGISSLYAKDLDCPVFLSPAPLDTPLETYLAPWKGREIWLDTALQEVCVTVTKAGSKTSPLPFSPPPENAFLEEDLHCRYRAQIEEDAIHFHLWRDMPQVEALIHHAQDLGVSKCIGLYQELYCDK